MQARYKKLLICAIVIIVILFIVYIAGLTDYCSLSTFQKQSDYLRCFVEQNYIVSVIVYIATYVAFIAASIPSVGPLTIIGGYLFGFLSCVVYSVIGATIGSSISFYVLRTMVTKLDDLQATPRILQLKKQLDKYGSLYLLALHFTVLVPFLVINTLAAFAGISWITFWWTTMIGFLPSAIIYAYAGKQITEITSLADLFSWPVMLALLLLVFLMLIPTLVHYFRKKTDLVRN